MESCEEGDPDGNCYAVLRFSGTVMELIDMECVRLVHTGEENSEYQCHNPEPRGEREMAVGGSISGSQVGKKRFVVILYSYYLKSAVNVKIHTVLKSISSFCFDIPFHNVHPSEGPKLNGNRTSTTSILLSSVQVRPL